MRKISFLIIIIACISMFWMSVDSYADEIGYDVVAPIYKYTMNDSGIEITYSEYGDSIVLGDNTNTYTVDNSRSSWSIEVNDWFGGNVDTVYDGEATYFFAKIYNGVVSDFVTIGDRAEYYE